MHSQLSITVSQIHQQELRQAARQARAASQPTTRSERTRRFRFTARTRQTVPAISATARMA